ncbi:CG34256, partial [Drosophila busckii]
VDLYWTRITKTDYINYAVELHCTPPWFRHQAAIYTRKKEPSEAVLKKITDYLTTVQLSLDKFKPQNMSTCKNYSNEPLQVWHRYRYMHLDFNPHFIRPLVKDKDI